MLLFSLVCLFDAQKEVRGGGGSFLCWPNQTVMMMIIMEFWRANFVLSGGVGGNAQNGTEAKGKQRVRVSNLCLCA